MKINQDFALRQIGDKWIAVSVSDETDNKKLFITLNETGAFIFKQLESEKNYDSIIKIMTDKYDVTEEKARYDFDRFLDIMRTHNIIEE